MRKLAVTLIMLVFGCGSDPPSRCPLEAPKDGAPCNSGGVVIYCHYDCTQGRSVDAYALCSGPHWTVTRYDICRADGGDE